MDHPSATFLAIESLWLFMGSMCMLLAAGMVVPSFGKRLASAFDRSGLLTEQTPTLLLVVFVPAVLTAFKLAQHEAHQLMVSSAIMANTLWNTAHGHGMVSNIDGGKSMLAGHFAFTYVLAAPFLRLWNSMSVLIIAHGFVIGLSVYGAYRLALHLGKSTAVAWLAALLLLSNPLFKSVNISFLDNANFAPPILIWAVYFWQTKRPWAAALLGLLLLTTREQIPFLLFGLGLYLALTAPNWKRRGLGLTMSVLSVLLWFFEMAIIARAKEGQADFYNFWGLFPALGGSREAVVHNLLFRPWLFPLAAVTPAVKLWTAAKIIFSFGFLPLASGLVVIPALAAWLPHQMADPDSLYHSLGEHYAAIVLGPIFLSSLWGLLRMHRVRKIRRWLIPGLLFVIGFNFISTMSFRPPAGSLPRAWRNSVPKVKLHVPDDAKLWCDEYLASDFALRRHIKALPLRSDIHFEGVLFAPDIVLFSTHWIRLAEPATTARIFSYLRREKYVQLIQEDDLIVLARPGYSSGQDTPVQLIKLANLK